jgi:mannose-6-phosphate isomerase-like protein (cupin superfamily)
MGDEPSALSPAEAAEILRATAVALQDELTGLPEAVVSWRPAPGEWCIKEALGHLIESERRGFAGRIRVMLAEDEPTLSAWDPEDVARERRDEEANLGTLLREFGDQRASSIALVAGLGDADLRRGGHHPVVGYLRAGDVLHEWIHHDRTHLRQMHAVIQAYVWPHMGHTQRFSQPQDDAATATIADLDWCIVHARAGGRIGAELAALLDPIDPATLHEYVLPAGTPVELHFHDFDEYWWFMGGEPIVTLWTEEAGRREYQLHPGDLVATVRGVAHTLRATQPLVYCQFSSVRRPGAREGHLLPRGLGAADC